jgi:hypothetical protein
MPSHGRQHYVNQSYLSGWVDPDTPATQEGYVWVFPRREGLGKRKAPRNLFYETDLYTLKLRNGARDIRIEKSLSIIEGMFAKVRAGPIRAREHVSDDDRAILAVFVAANLARTLKQRNHLRGQFGRILEIGEQMTEAMRAKRKELSPAEYNAYVKSVSGVRPPTRDNEISIDAIKELHAHPLQHLMWPQIQARSSELYEMYLTFATTTDATGFVTSDAPTVVRRFGLEGIPFHWRPTSFLVGKTEVCMPISPDALAIFHLRAGIDEYVAVRPSDLDEWNEVACYYSHEEVVVRRNQKPDGWYRRLAAWERGVLGPK